VVAIIHGGISARRHHTEPAGQPAAPTPGSESPSYYLAQVKNVDAMLMGHSHLIFPSAAATSPGFNVQGVDKVKGIVNGVPLGDGEFSGASTWAW